MKTIAIGYTYEGEDYRPLVKALYDYTLKDDPLFCFFFGQNRLVISISKEQCWQKTVAFLRRKEIAFEGYSAPCPPNPDAQNGEVTGSVAENNLELLLPVFHAHAVAAITLSQTDHYSYRERVTHAAFNPRYCFHKQEGVELIVSGLRRLVLAQELEAEQAKHVLENILDVLKEGTTTCCSQMEKSAFP